MIVIGITSAFSFAQYDTLLPKQGDKFTIATVANKIEQSSATFKWFNSYVVYSGRNISFKAKTPLTEKPQILTKTSKVIMFNSGSFPNANFPFVSNIIPKVGSLGVVSEVYVIDNDAGTYIGNKNVARGQLSAQLCIEAIYRTIDTAGSTSKTSNAYFIAKTADKASESYTLTENDNKLFTTDKYLTGCDNYYIAYCGDGIVDKKSGDAATDGQGGMSIDGTFLTWNLAPTTDEVCDEGTLNGTAGHCKTDCSGIG
ncbi:TPA: hypothetical protein DEP21_02840 [Patescibacteria group bacterium]|nr:hypothetical protein [Candidatus Gracilibacteria bacterium]